MSFVVLIQRYARVIPFACVFLLFCALVWSQQTLGSYAVVGRLLCFHPIPYLGDLHILLEGLDAIRAGLDPYQGVFNYPRALELLLIFPFVKDANLVLLGISIIVVFYFVLYILIGRITVRDAVVYSAMLCSPAVMLAVDRCNCDLIIMIFLATGLIFFRARGVLAAAILAGAILKLFPIGALACLVNAAADKIKRGCIWLLAVGFGFSLYFLVSFPVMVSVSRKTPRPYDEASYGLWQVPSLLISRFEWLGHYKAMVFGLFVSCIVSLVIYVTRMGREPAPLVMEDRKGMAFLAGSGIFLTTCLIGYNWEYRLIFLILTVPQLLAWIDEGRAMVVWVLGLTLLVMFQSFFEAIVSVSTHGLYYHEIKFWYYVFGSKLLVVLLFVGHTRLFLGFARSVLVKLCR